MEAGRKTIEKLVAVARSRIESLPYYRDADAICAVPPRPGKGFDLPTEVVERLANVLDIPDLTPQLQWKGAKPSLKETPFEEKWDALAGVGMKPAEISAKAVIVFDDLYQSGITIQFVASHLVRCGAKQIFGMTIVKSRGDQDNQ